MMVSKAHKNILCNTIHLYLWIFLLCMPFTFYLVSILYMLALTVSNNLPTYFFASYVCGLLLTQQIVVPNKRIMQKALLFIFFFCTDSSRSLFSSFCLAIEFLIAHSHAARQLLCSPT